MRVNPPRFILSSREKNTNLMNKLYALIYAVGLQDGFSFLYYMTQTLQLPHAAAISA